MNIFAPITTPEENSAGEEGEPDLKYARSALTSDPKEKLADRLEAVMRNETLYLDPGLSL